MVFIDHVWVSASVAVGASLLLLIVSVIVRDWRRRAGFNKAAWLTLAALAIAYVKGGALFAALLLALAVFNYFIAFAIERAVNRRERHQAATPASTPVPLLLAITVNVAAAVACAFGGFIRAPIGRLSGTLVPFGISYFALHAISYMMDVHRRRAFAQKRRWQVAAYLLLFPQMLAGPLAYEGVAPQLARGAVSVSDFSYGVRRFLIGVWKTLIVAAMVGQTADLVFRIPAKQLTASQAWVGIVCFTVQVYFAFSGYSDMGIGLGRMVGFRLPENFRWPYVAQTMSEFWTRWHMGLCAWFREYGDTSLDPEHVPPPGVVREALMIIACAIWYRARWTLLIWGGYNALLVAAEYYWLGAAIRRLPMYLRHAYVVVAVVVGWVFFRSDAVGNAFLYLKAMAGLAGAAPRVRLTIQPEVWFLLAAGLVGSAPLVPSIRRWSVAIDALTTSLLMMLFATAVFIWRTGWIVVSPVATWWRGSPRRRYVSRP